MAKKDSRYMLRRSVDFLRAIRKQVVRTLRPTASYYLFKKVQRTTEPLSEIYGYDRGNPVDRFYIERFMEANQDLIKGHCLEITDNDYTIKYGGTKVTKSDALDIDTNNRHATIYADLRKVTNVESNTFDCLIATQTFMLIDDVSAAISECHRMLKPGGVMLCTLSVTGKVVPEEYWRLTEASTNYLFGNIFGKENVEVKTHGNALIVQANTVGMAQDEVTQQELETDDPLFPVIITVKAVKK